MGATDPRFKGNHIGEGGMGGGSKGATERGPLGIGVSRGIAGQDRSNRSGRHEATRGGLYRPCGRFQGTGGHTRRGVGLTGGDGETAVVFGTYNSKRPRSPTGYTRAGRKGTASLRPTL